MSFSLKLLDTHKIQFNIAYYMNLKNFYPIL